MQISVASGAGKTRALAASNATHPPHGAPQCGGGASTLRSKDVTEARLFLRRRRRVLVHAADASHQLEEACLVVDFLLGRPADKVMGVGCVLRMWVGGGVCVYVNKENNNAPAKQATPNLRLEEGCSP